MIKLRNKALELFAKVTQLEIDCGGIWTHALYAYKSCGLHPYMIWYNHFGFLVVKSVEKTIRYYKSVFYIAVSFKFHSNSEWNNYKRQQPYFYPLED